MFCAKCGYAIETGDIFCEDCGHKVDQRENNPTTCEQCGYDVEDGDAFCENCGRRVTTTSASRVAPLHSTNSHKPVPASDQTRMPLIFLLDASALASPYINQLTSGLNGFKKELCQDSHVKNALEVAIVQFNDGFDVLQNFAPIEKLNPVRLIAGGQANYGAATQKAIQMAEAHPHYPTDTYKPWVVLISFSDPSDNVAAISSEIKNAQSADKLRFIALGAGNYNSSSLKQLTDVVFRLDGDDFSAFFSWISQCMGVITRSTPGTKPRLPQLQGNVYRDI